MALSQDFIDAVGNVDLKNGGESPAIAFGVLNHAFAQAAAIAAQNLVTQQQRLNAIQDAVVTTATNKLLNIDPAEATSLSKLNTGNDLAQQLAALLATVSANQQSSKVAGNTPPVTP